MKTAKSPVSESYNGNGKSASGDMKKDVLEGLCGSVKSIPCKYFYDARGSELFDKICELPEYYQTRTEIGLLSQHGAEMASQIGPRSLILEFGSGSGIKTEILLKHLENPVGYIPIEIARKHLMISSKRLRQKFPKLQVLPLCADYTQEIRLPTPTKKPSRKVAFFPGSTIGNFNLSEAKEFLERVREIGGLGSGFLVGVDIKKDKKTLEAAYNDAQGITGAFNLNILERINNEIYGNFVLDNFKHLAFYNEEKSRIEMKLVSLKRQSVMVSGQSIGFQKGETITTEYSYKYDVDDFIRLASSAGFTSTAYWVDPKKMFSIYFLTVN